MRAAEKAIRRLRRFYVICGWFDLPLLHQLRLKIRQIKEISGRLNFSVLINFHDTDALQEEDISGLGLKTYPPFDGSFLTADRDVN